ncbi:Glycosyl hydrolase family 12 [uncultured archaeon]|nr:Glycosyl hydrolase family 12 [uncultured archaeon]
MKGILLFILLIVVIGVGVATVDLANHHKESNKVGGENGTSIFNEDIVSQSLILHNNVWGATEEEKNKTLKSYIYVTHNNSFGWEWDRPNPDYGLYYIPPIYPEAIIGVLPYSNNKSTSSYFPIKSKDIYYLTADINYQYIKPTTGDYNLAFDIYWMDPSDLSNKKSNVMIWIYGRLEDSTPIKYVSDGTNEFEYHYRAPKDDQYWPWHAFILKNQEKTNITVNIKALLDQLPEGSLNDKWTVQAIEFGSEIWKGSGRIKIDKYNINLNGNIITNK